MKKQNFDSVHRYTRPVACRAVAAVLAGLMLVSSVPASAIAEEIQEAQQTAIVQADAGTAATTNTDVKATTDATTTDATTTTDAATTDDATDKKDAATTDKKDATTDASTTTTDKKDAATSTTTEKKDDTTSDTNIPGASNRAVNPAKTRTWNSYGGRDQDQECVDGLKTICFSICSAIGDAAGGKFGSALVDYLGIFSACANKSTEVTTNDIMNKLYDMENQISGVATQVYNLQSSLDNLKADENWREDANELNGFKELLCTDKGVTRGIAAMSDELNKHPELDENGKVTDVSCSLETPVERMSKEARDGAMAIVKQMDDVANTCTCKDTVLGVEDLLYRGIALKDRNYVDDYFNLLKLRFNWDVESLPAKKNFVTMLGQMYVNAYMVSNASLRLQIAEAQAAGENTSMLEGQLETLANHAVAVKNALFGEDGNSGYLAQTRLADENKLTCYINDVTYDKGTYACVSAYPASCFEHAVKEGTEGGAGYGTKSWSANSTFTTDQVSDMVTRLKAMKESGCAPKKADGTEVDGILEEMEALGFKNVKTDGDEGKTTWKDRLSCNHGWHDSENVVSNRFIELGDPTQKNYVFDYSDFHMGDRLENSSDWVLTNVTKPRADASGGYGLNDTYCGFCAYGDVVNVKDGTIVKDQLLYVLHNQTNYKGWFPFTRNKVLSTLEYYAFGCLRLGTTDPTIDAIK